MNISRLVAVAILFFSVVIIAHPVFSQSNSQTVFIPNIANAPEDRFSDPQETVQPTPPVIVTTTVPTVVPTTPPTQANTVTPIPSDTPTDSPPPLPTYTHTPTVIPTNTATPTNIPTETPTIVPTGTNTPISISTSTPTFTTMPTLTPISTPWPEDGPDADIQVLPQYSVRSSDFASYLVGQVEETVGGRANLVRVTANFYNGAQLTGTDYTYTPLDVVMPDTTTCFQIFMLEDIPTYTHIEYEVTHSSGREISTGLVSENVSLNVDDDDVEVIGLVHNSGQKKSTFVKVVITLFDEAGTPIGCDYAYVNSTHLNPGQTSSFKVDFLNLELPVDSYRVQVQGRPSDEPPFIPRIRVLPHTYTYSGTIIDYLVGEIEAEAGEATSQIKVTVNFYDGETLTGTDWTYPPMDRLVGSERTCFQLIHLGSLPSYTHYEFEISHEGPRDIASGLTIYNDSASVNESWARIIGSVRNDGQATAEFVKVIVTLYDTDGVPIECDSGYVNSRDLTPGQSSTFDINFINNGPMMDSYRLQVQGRP